MGRPDEMWHEPPNSTGAVKKLNHRAGRYAVWGNEEGGREQWRVVDGQGPEGKPLADAFDSREEAIRAAESIIEQNEQSQRGTRADPR